MKRVSEKMAAQKIKERELSQKLLERCQGVCECCGSPGDWRGLSKHENVFRSHGGNPLDPKNCVLVCGRCHSAFHRIKEA